MAPAYNRNCIRWLLVAFGAVVAARPSGAQGQTFDRSRDRGPGVPLSIFGTTIEKGELIVYPFFEYYHDNDAEYSPIELGYGVDLDYRGRYRASEGLLFIGYGITDAVAVEVEAAVITATLDKSPDDPSAVPSRLGQSGLGDVESEVRWRMRRETEGGPEVFSYFETVFPIQKTKRLIGTQDWELKLGAGIVRGFRWGTATVRLAAGYDEGSIEPGEYAVEYVKRVSSLLRVFGAVEGSEDEVELITETQWFLRENLILKVNNAFGVTSKATGWAPEIGLMFRFR